MNESPVVSGEEAERLKAANLAVTLLSVAAFMVTADVRVISPLLRVIADQFKTDIGATNLIVSAYALPYGLFQLVYGPLADRFGKLKVVTYVLVLFGLGTAACGLAPNLPILILLRFITGVAAAAVIPASLSYIGDNFAYAGRQVVIGRFLGAVALAQVLSAALGGIIADFLDWRYIFVIFGVGSLAICYPMWRLQSKAPDLSNPEIPLGVRALRPYFRLLQRADVWLVIGAVFVEGFFFFGSFSFFGAFLRDKYGLDYLYIGLILSGFGIGSLIYTRSVKKLVAALGESGLMIWGSIIMAACLVITAVLELWPVFIVLIIALGLGYYMLHSTLQTKATELDPKSRSTAFSLFAFMLFVGQAIGTALMGVVVDSGYGYEVVFLVCAVGLVSLGGDFVSLEKRLKKARP